MNRVPSLHERSSGVLLHPTSLPGPPAIGDIGPAAYHFVDWLADAGQRWWQMLPVGPIGRGNSPYESLSAFAGNSLLVSLEKLAGDGLLELDDLPAARSGTPHRVQYATARRFKNSRLRRAFSRFERLGTADLRQEFDRFRADHDAWLPDFALFSALKHLYRGCCWTEWPAKIRLRRKPALARIRVDHEPEVRYHEFVQFLFHRQWAALRQHCRRKGIGLIGDLPIFVAHDSADVWASPRLFWLDRAGKPTVVAGVGPDYFSKDGQIWGNPLYRWAELRRQGYGWWIARFQGTFEKFDVVRLDHFIGFHRFWEIPAAAKTARGCRWRPGPGAEFFDTVRRQLGELPVIAEDLGVVTPEVEALRDRFEFPGMRVLQFAFGNDAAASSFRPHNYPRNCVVYTGTHDNDTTVGWFRDTGSRSSTRTAGEIMRERANALQYLGSTGREIHWDLIRAALMSIANTAIIPAQDLLGLDSNARMNRPGIANGNWQWRLAPNAMNSRLAERLHSLTKMYGRA